MLLLKHISSKHGSSYQIHASIFYINNTVKVLIKPAQNPCKRPAGQHPATMKVAAATSVELVSTV